MKEKQFKGNPYIFRNIDKPITIGESKYIDSQSKDKELKTRTSLRLDRYLLWQLELISRVSKFKNIKNNRTFSDIINNMMNLSLFPEKIDNEFSSQLQSVKHHLNKAFTSANDPNKIFIRTLPELTYDTDYIMRTLALALFDSYLLSEFEIRLLKVILKNKKFVNTPCEYDESLNNSELVKNIVQDLRRKISFDWYSLYYHFGPDNSELKIQVFVMELEIDEDADPWGWTVFEKEYQQYPHKEEYDQIPAENENEREEYKKKIAFTSLKNYLKHHIDLNGEPEAKFRSLLSISEKKGDFSGDRFLY